MIFSITVKLFNIFLIMSVIFLIVLLLKICFHFIISEIFKNLNFLLLNYHYF